MISATIGTIKTIISQYEEEMEVLLVIPDWIKR